MIVDVSINEFSSINLWSNDPSTIKLFDRYVPWYMVISLNDPVLLTILPDAFIFWVVVVVIDSGT